ncbi:MAG TPA: radical SAM family heme chaperone HemW [Miltoncostaeaceae bacterium]|nr:radical SAM family heme chaperone HemW [Miltoncostaeaceae bacterium]
MTPPVAAPTGGPDLHRPSRPRDAGAGEGSPARPAPVRHLYVHLPFCRARCGYCAFVVETGALHRRDAYLEALGAELGHEEHRLGVLDTVYLGGGTPTLMRPRRIARLLDGVAHRCAPDAEITIEANPETVDGRQLADLRAAGVTRLSLGAQSFQPALLRALDRGATPEQVRAAVRCARRAGFASLSMDLLFGVPGQTRAQLEADIAELEALGVDHVSWYELEIKPDTALARMGAEVPDEDWSADAYERVVAALEQAGYRWYETANFARPGHECRHSLAYWGAADYLGVGVGAVSTVGGRRWRNAPGVAQYVAALAAGDPPARGVEELDPDTRRRERWMLGLRLAEGLDMAWAGPADRPEALERLIAGGLARRDGDHLTLSRRGRMLQNAILGEVMEYA